VRPRTSAEAKEALRGTNRALYDEQRFHKRPEMIAFLVERRMMLRELKRRLRKQERDHDESWRFACSPQPRGTMWQDLRGYLADTRRAQERLAAPEEEWKLQEAERARRV
jgi:hypothetical protein